MSKVIASITTSVDGDITGPDDGPEYGLGRGGERLHVRAHAPHRGSAGGGERLPVRRRPRRGTGPGGGGGRGTATSPSVAALTSFGRRWRRGSSTSWSFRQGLQLAVCHSRALHGHEVAERHADRWLYKSITSLAASVSASRTPRTEDFRRPPRRPTMNTCRVIGTAGNSRRTGGGRCWVARWGTRATPAPAATNCSRTLKSVARATTCGTKPALARGPACCSCSRWYRWRSSGWVRYRARSS